MMCQSCIWPELCAKIQFVWDILKVTRLDNLRFYPHKTFHVHGVNVHVPKCKRLHLWFHSTVSTSSTVSNRTVTQMHADGIRNDDEAVRWFFWHPGWGDAIIPISSRHPTPTVIASLPPRFVHRMSCDPPKCNPGWRGNFELKTSTLWTLSIEKSLTWNEIK